MERHLYTVVVLLPDWLADTFGQDIYIAQVDTHTDDVQAAAEAGRRMASQGYIDSPDELADFFVLAVFSGHVHSIFSDHYNEWPHPQGGTHDAGA